MLSRATQIRDLAPEQRVASLAVDWRGLAAFALPLLVYVLTLAPTIYNLDSAELTTAAATGGLIRATGYPVYLILGGLWSHLPVGDVGYRMNLLSAVSGAATIFMADRILRRLGVGAWASLGGLGLLATAPFYWGLAVVAEVYTLHTALMAGVILLLLRWRERPTAARLGLVALVGGLSMGHHLATTMLVPGAVAFVLVAAPRRALQPRALAAMAAGGLAGLLVYLYLPLRQLADPAFNYVGSYDAAGVFHPLNLWDPANLWWLVRGGQFSGNMLGYDAAGWVEQALGFGAQLFRSFFAVGIGPGLAGAVLLARRDRALGAALLLMFVMSTGFYIGYRVMDKETMYLPSYLVWAVWASFGYQRLSDWVAQEGYGPWERRLVRGLMLGGAVAALIWNWSLADHSRDWSTRERGEAILAAAEPDALVLGWWDTVPLVEYHQLVEGRRPDIVAVNRFLITRADLEALVAAEIRVRPVYIDVPTTELLSRYRVEPAGPIYRLETRAAP